MSPLKGMPLTHLYLDRTKVTDLSALSAMPLAHVRLQGCTELTDVSALANSKELKEIILPPNATNFEFLRNFSKLERISFQHDANTFYRPDQTAAEFWKEYDEQGWLRTLRESDFKPKSMQRLGDGTWEVNLENTTLVDLSILKGAPISRLNLSNTTVAELTPLKGMPLVALNINATLVADLSALRGMPLTELRMLNPRKITDLSPLSDCKELQILTLPENAKNFELLRTLLKLERISFQDDPNNGYRPDMSTTEFWKEYAPESWQSRLRNSGLEIKTLKKLPDGTWEVNLDKSAVSDLTILIGAPISRLWLNSTAVSDLTPLRGMPLRKLAIFNTKVADLSPLEGMQLDYLNLTATKVADLSLLRGMPLVSLRLNDCLELTDLSPLEGATTLTQLSLPPNATNFEFLRAFPKLERLSFKGDPSNSYRPDKTAAEFWQEYDAKKN